MCLVSREMRCHGCPTPLSSPGKVPLHPLPALRGSGRTGFSFLDLHFPQRHPDEAQEGMAAPGSRVRAVPDALAGI